MKRSRVSHFALLAMLAGGGCSLQPDGGAVGAARATITVVPANVACVQIIAAGGHTLTFNSDVTPGTSSQIQLNDLPVGNVTFTGFAFAASCAMIAGTEPSWASAPTPSTILPGQVTNISLTLEPVGGANVGVSFDTDGGVDSGVNSGVDGGTATAACGNGVRDPGEQCDDGNVVNLDGCDASCKLEQEQRVNSLQMLFTTDSFCTANALGGAIAGIAQASLQATYTSGVSSGSLTMGFKFMPPIDLLGQTGGAALGNLSGTPAAAPGGVTYNGNSDLDWWYTSTASLLDSARNPTQVLSGSIAQGVLNASGRATLPLGLGNNAPVNVNVRLKANLGAASVPTLSSGTAPGHLFGEHLDPALISFASMTSGELCGNISARSLSTLPAPAALASGSSKCTNAIGSTLLDVLVDGCSVIFVKSVNATPTADQVDPAAAVTGAGGPYTFVSDATGHVTSCKDRLGAAANLDACLDGAAYSSAYTFTADRVIFK